MVIFNFLKRWGEKALGGAKKEVENGKEAPNKEDVGAADNVSESGADKSGPSSTPPPRPG